MLNKVNIADHQLSPHFSLYEFLESEKAAEHGIDNTPSDATVHALQQLAERLERVREILGQPLHISSGYRCPDLNAIVGSKPSSDHCKGLAADFVCPAFGTPVDICHRLVASDVPFKQLIYERTWVHISFDIQAELAGAAPKRQVLTLLAGGAGYGNGILEVA